MGRGARSRHMRALRKMLAHRQQRIKTPGAYSPASEDYVRDEIAALEYVLEILEEEKVMDEVKCPTCGAYGDMHCSTKSGRDHRTRMLAEQEKLDSAKEAQRD